MMSIKDHQNGPAMHLSNTVQVFLLLDAGLAQRARIIPKLNSYVHNSSKISTVNDWVWSLGSLPGSISKPGFYRYNQSFVSMRISKAWLCQLILVFHAMTARWCMTQWFICEPTPLRQWLIMLAAQWLSWYSPCLTAPEAQVWSWSCLLSVWRLHLLPMTMLVSSGCSGFLLYPKHVQIGTLIGLC